MRRFLQSLAFFTLAVIGESEEEVTVKNGDAVTFNIYEDSDAFQLGLAGCKNEPDNCMYLAVNAIERYKSGLYGSQLEGWRYNEVCKCQMPPRPEKQELLQFLHIPKTGTSLNWFLHDYFIEDCGANESPDPCPRHLANVRSAASYIVDVSSDDDFHDHYCIFVQYSDQTSGLCNGKLFSCAGHRVAAELPKLVFTTRTNMLTMLRHPWYRLQVLNCNPFVLKHTSMLHCAPFCILKIFGARTLYFTCLYAMAMK
jgi:hypothetical protein